MLSWNMVQRLRPEHFQVGTNDASRVLRVNNVINEPPLGTHHRISKGLGVLVRVPVQFGRTARGATTVEDFHGSLGPHDGNLRAGIGIIGIAAQVFAGHDIVSATVGLAGNDGDFGHGRFRVGKQQFGAVADNPAVFLRQTGQEPGHIDQGDERYTKSVTKADEPCGFGTSGNIETTGKDERIVGHNTNRLTVDTAKAGANVGGVVGHDFVPHGWIVLIEDRSDNIAHIVRGVRIVRNHTTNFGR
jgi:hypothetical protein